VKNDGNGMVLEKEGPVVSPVDGGDVGRVRLSDPRNVVVKV